MYHQTVVHLPVPRRDYGHLLSEMGLVVLDIPAWSPRLLQRQNEGGLARRSLHLNSLFLHQRAAKLIFVVSTFFMAPQNLHVYCNSDI